jgi:predicted dehydrogenase
MSLRGAISGFGEMAARAHLPGWQSRSGINLVAIHDPIAARRHHAINLIKNIRVYDDLQLMLDGEALDFLDVASPPAFHAAAARLALEADVNVIVEKPLCLDLHEFEELSSLSARRSRLLACVHNWKYSPAYKCANDLVSGGRLGRVRYVSLIRMRNQPAGSGGNRISERWRLDPKSGGGILIDHGWHSFYLAQWLMGGDVPLSISGSLGFDPATGVDDFADLRIEFAQHRIVNIHLSWRAPARKTTAVIVGSEGMIEIEGDQLLLMGRSGEVVEYPVIDSPDDSYHAAWFRDAASDFERLFAQGPQSELAQVNLREAAAAVALTAAARRSAAQDGGVITLPTSG